MKFATTAKMSSYLAALVVGNFEYVEGSVDGIPIRVYSTPGKKEMGKFALEAAEYIVGYYDKYFGIKYPYGKLDLIGLPDFSAGAMENIGCITFREVILLIDEEARLGRSQEDHRIGHRARDGSQVVRRSGHDEVVGRYVAQRRLCHLDVEQAGCRNGSRNGILIWTM